jgi:NADH:ubiquinone oxidoreductase subunit F (NADH-binding)
VIHLCGGIAAPAQAILVGGYFGSWLPPDLELPLANEALRPLGAALGARALAVLPMDVCGVVESARVAVYMAGQGAGQCGPCVFGLPAVAECLGAIARCEPGAAAALERLPRLDAQIAGRGACAHPDGTLGFVRSALSAFENEIEEHLAGRCSAVDHEPLLPTPATSTDWR